MSYSNKIDAANKLSDGFVINNTLPIYRSSNSFNNNTIFYTDSGKTVTLTTGYYVVPTNYRTLFVGIGGDGKLSGTTEYLFTSPPDSSFVEETIFSKQTNLRTDEWTIVNCTLSGNTLTDSNWYNPTPSGKPKQWVINMSNRSVAPLTNLNLSEMAGYDLLFYVGGYGVNNSFDDDFGVTFFVHIQQNLNRTTVFTQGIYRKRYFFKPDYWYAKPNIDSPTFFNRNLFLTRLKNKRGSNKLSTWTDPLLYDIVQSNKTNTKTPTRKDRGVNWELHLTDPKSYNTTTSITFNRLGGSYVDADYVTTKDEGYYFDQPNLVGGSVFSESWGYGFSPSSELDNVRLTATWRSIYLGDFVGSYTHNGITVNYSEANPNQWGMGFENPATRQFRDYLFDSEIDWFWDMEWFTVLMFDEIGLRGVFGSFKYAKDYVVNNNLQARDTKITWYAGGVYRKDGDFNSNDGSLPNTSNYTNSNYYKDYNDYYIGNASRETLLCGYNPVFYDFAEYFNQFAIGNYLNDYNSFYYFYKMLHQYDISNKLMTQRFGQNHQLLFTPLMFNVYETVAGTTMNSKRKVVGPDGQPYGAKPDISPDFWQSLAAWSFGYGDGCFIWNSGKWVVEDYQDIVWDDLDGNNPAEIYKNDFAGADWYFATIAHMYQNKDIIEATNTDWFYVSQDKGDSYFTTGSENYPVVSYVFQRPLITAKFSSDGTEALVLALNPFNNGYTKSSVNVELVSGQVMSIDMWGTYTSILRVKIN